MRDLKKEKAKTLISDAVSNSSDWGNLATNDDYFKYLSEETSTLSGAFTSIGKSSELEGALISLKVGEISKIIETPSSYLFLEVTNKTEFNEDDFFESSENIKNQLLSTKRSRGYFQWLNSRKDQIEIDDWRDLIY